MYVLVKLTITTLIVCVSEKTSKKTNYCLSAHEQRRCSVSASKRLLVSVKQGVAVNEPKLSSSFPCKQLPFMSTIVSLLSLRVPYLLPTSPDSQRSVPRGGNRKLPAAHCHLYSPATWSLLNLKLFTKHPLIRSFSSVDDSHEWTPTQKSMLMTFFCFFLQFYVIFLSL